MPVFTYEARDRQGNRVQGVVEAAEQRSAVRQLQESGYYVTAVRHEAGTVTVAPAGPSVAGSIFGVNARDLSLFFREIYQMLHAGITLVRAFELLGENSSNPTLRSIAKSVAPELASGKQLSGELQKFPNVFSPLVTGLITAGEAGGFLDRVCLQLSQYLEKEHELRQRLRRETFYPKAVIVVGLIVGAIVPSAPSLVAGQPGPFFVTLLNSLLRLALPIGVIGGLWLALRMRVGGNAVRAAIDQAKLMVPGVGNLLRKIALAKFCRALAALYTAGVAFPKALGLAADASGNQAVIKAVRSRLQVVEKGGRLSDIMKESSLFPPIVLNMVLTGEETGALDDTLNKVADYFEMESETSMHMLARVAGVAALVLVAMFVVVPMLSSFYLGYFNNLLEAAKEIE